MVSGFSEFSWDVYIDGYFWVEGFAYYPTGGLERGLRSARDRYLVARRDELGMRTPNDQSDLSKSYAPLRDHDALHREFADIDPTEKTAAAFANKYGQLGGDIAHTCYVWNPSLPPLLVNQLSTMPLSIDSVPPYLPFLGDTLDGWRREIKAMKRTVTLWEHLVSGKKKLVQNHLEKEWGKGVGMDLHWDEILIKGYELLRDDINKHLLKRISPEMRSRQRKHNLGLRIVPDSLIGALWLQFALAVDGNKEYKQCKMCSTWFEIGRTESYSPEAGFRGRARKDKTYCSNACRSRALREKKKEARRLYEKSITIDEIAKTLGSEQDTVRGWVGK